MNQMRKVTLFLALAMIAVLTVGGLCFGAEKYPTKPIQVIVPFAAGGSSDLLARTVEKVLDEVQPPADGRRQQAGGRRCPGRRICRPLQAGRLHRSMSDRAPATTWSCRTCRRCPSTP